LYCKTKSIFSPLDFADHQCIPRPRAGAELACSLLPSPPVESCRLAPSLPDVDKGTNPPPILSPNCPAKQRTFNYARRQPPSSLATLLFQLLVTPSCRLAQRCQAHLPDRTRVCVFRRMTSVDQQARGAAGASTGFRLKASGTLAEYVLVSISPPLHQEVAHPLSFPIRHHPK
jgi:hypothetical protein